jgi:tRNA(Arg) A34 adenosine deaminase TadA
MKHMKQSMIAINLPDWLAQDNDKKEFRFPTVEARMTHVIGLSRMNYRSGTGGPFAAAVFDMNDGLLLASGVNLVLDGKCSVLHAEIVAIMIAQRNVGTYDLSSSELPSYELVSSTEPCAMCMGAITWAGIRNLVCGARGCDAEDLGFDEGEKPSRWIEALERRGISVTRDICRDQAAAVLREYLSGGGVIYNPRRAQAG